MKLNSETCHFICLHARDDVHMLALQTPQPGVDLEAAIIQIAGRQALAGKVPSWTAHEDLLFPTRLPLEQCSSEATARYKAEVVRNCGGVRKRMADLTGGLGVDCAFLAPLFEQVDYVERQEGLCNLAQHNFTVLGLPHINVHQAQAEEFLSQTQGIDWIYLDPARRDGHGGKTVAIAHCEPDATQLEPLMLDKAPHVLLKLSPMLDLAQALQELKHVASAHVVAVDNECKELLLVLERGCNTEAGDVPISCINLSGRNDAPQPNAFLFTRNEERTSPCPLAEKPQTYLYEPHAVLLKAGAFRRITQVCRMQKLHPNSHLYTSDHLVEDFPGRIFCIQGWSGFGKKELKTLLGPEKRANLSVRNFPATVAELRKRLHLADGGETYLFATTLSAGEKVLIRTVKAR